MKYWIWGIILGVFCAVTWAGETYRDFTNTQGQTVRGRVLSYDGRKDMVTIELENKRKATAPVNGFSEADQQYIHTWALLEGVRSESKFKISCDRRIVDDWTEKKIGTIRYSNGAVEENQVVGKTFFEQIGFDISLVNRNDYALEDLILKYCIYYVQDENTAGEAKKGVLCGSESIDSIEGFKKKDLSTPTVVIFKDETNADLRNSQVFKGDVEGIVLRICTPDKDGGEVLRTVSLPDSLSGSHNWADQSVMVGKNR